ncbi:EamA family transporter RarD [Testudinibacter sp. TR-2022]|uniref:EamA family transporter RarD n=1 Tax=Testudinibacter sp. TR-2022 TaxID=2585029 RepID=UPI001118FC48|nr:EamA family transporter RarD [Testudinibacter sp. TR-2022]TNH03861.1 EamA family transporter RarD [Pasteurellaceae bacterium Phil31]TNH08669.1 EamA family transporter RarD [Testudinibacter sp. TR-2022]TNH08752.1 EamA family transporter RarD [Testudinibacter sp. TR-2022]TNH14836.1 EamA family transporter RarD [Testudinibacter sp. TR-2022]TNH18354.1 EamA family transporter RarD [Testudinibacter sp. TR-2022]
MTKGLLCSLLASALFGYLYYFTTLLTPLSGLDALGFRILFMLPAVLAVLLLFKQQKQLCEHLTRIKQQPFLLLVVIFNAAMMGFQMWLYLWAPNNGSAVEVTVGYLLLPLVLVAFGKFLFKETISRYKALAILCAGIAVLLNILLTGRMSWESLAVSLGYALYFASRKFFKMNDLAVFTLEVSLLFPFCVYMVAQVDLAAAAGINPHIYLLVFLLGLISSIAFIAYILASNWLPINLLGLLGYLETVAMLFISLYIGETIQPASYPLLFGLSAAMLLLMYDGFRLRKKALA